MGLQNAEMWEKGTGKVLVRQSVNSEVCVDPWRGLEAKWKTATVSLKAE